MNLWFDFVENGKNKE